MADRTGAELAGAIAPRPSSEEEQLEFLPPPTRFAGALAERQVETVRAHQRGPGRPPGARNRKTSEMLDYCRRVFGDPVLETFRWVQHTPETLARELGCTTLEAFDRLDGMRARLERLFYAQRAPVDASGQAVVPSFTLAIGAGAAAGQVGARPWEGKWSGYDAAAGEIQHIEQNQALSGAAPAVSHGAVSHGGAK